MAISTIGTDSISGLGYGFKNRIINGAMTIDQRNAGASVTPVNSQYTLDRWQCGLTQTSKFTVQQNAGSVTPPTGFTNYLGATSSSSYSVPTNDYFYIGQLIEGYNVADLDFGKLTAKPITISFWVRSSLTGTFGGSFLNGAANRSCPFSYTISSANTWEQKSVTIAGDTTGTWLTTNGLGLYVLFSLGSGAGVSGTAGSWAGSTYISATGATSVVGTNGATFYITGVQLEVGSTATSFDYRPYGTELALCQRYYYRLSLSNQSLFSMVLTSATAGRSFIPFPVTMRTSPTGIEATASVWNLNAYASGVGTGGNASFNAANPYACEVIISGTTTTGASAGTGGSSYTSTAGYIGFTGAEL